MKVLTKQQAKDVLGVGTTVFSEYCNRHIDPIPFAYDPLHPKILRVSERDLWDWIKRNFCLVNPPTDGDGREGS